MLLLAFSLVFTGCDPNGGNGNGDDCDCNTPCLISNCPCPDCPGDGNGNGNGDGKQLKITNSETFAEGYYMAVLHEAISGDQVAGDVDVFSDGTKKEILFTLKIVDGIITNDIWTGSGDHYIQIARYNEEGQAGMDPSEVDGNAWTYTNGDPDKYNSIPLNFSSNLTTVNIDKFAVTSDSNDIVPVSLQGTYRFNIGEHANNPDYDVIITANTLSWSGNLYIVTNVTDTYITIIANPDPNHEYHNVSIPYELDDNILKLQSGDSLWQEREKLI